MALFLRCGGEKCDQGAEQDRVEPKSSEHEGGGERYLCHQCYCKGPESLPKGYEDVKNVPETRARKMELGH